MVHEIRHTNDQLNIPQGIKNCANGGIKTDATGEPVMVSEKELLEKFPTIAANAEQDVCTPENPRKTMTADFKKILTCCYYDEPVNF
jgi:alcohol dehydrogenase class IV